MPLNVKPDQSRLTTLLTDTVVLLCKNGLNFQSTLRIVGVLGVTIDDSDVFIVHVNENVSNVAPDAPDITSHSDAVDRPKTQDGCRRFPAEKINLLRAGKSPGRASNKPVVDSAGESRLKGSSLTEDGAMKTDRDSVICIKEENVEVTSPEGDNRNISYGRQEEDCGTSQVVSKRERRTFRWAREVGHVSASDPTDYGAGSNETFAQNDGRVGESHGGTDVADEWNLDMLALSSLPGAMEGDGVPPWPGYVWSGGGSYPQECLSGEMSHAQSQSMVGVKTRDGLTQPPDVERHGGFAMLKPFACPVLGCSRRFYHRNNVYRHRKQKHGESVLGLMNRRR